LVQPLRAASDSSEAGNKAANLRLLALAGIPVPNDAVVVPVAVVDRLRTPCAEAAELWRGVIADIVAAARGRALCLRSSSLIEDSSNHSGAGIYESEINVRPEPAAIRDALSRVIDSRSSRAAEAYQRVSRPSHAFDCRIAVLVHEYVDCDYQGVAHTRSPWSAGSSLIECFDGHASVAAAQRRGVLLERPHAQRAIDAGADAITSLWSTLGRVDALAKQCAAVLGGHSDVEWCVRGSTVTILQARRLTDLQFADRSRTDSPDVLGGERCAG
jgi:phosphoenolpyruvate synthase/pyruvate phosphate dikinase